jgi:hypothetical protein
VFFGAVGYGWVGVQFEVEGSNVCVSVVVNATVSMVALKSGGVGFEGIEGVGDTGAEEGGASK